MPLLYAFGRVCCTKPELYRREPPQCSNLYCSNADTRRSFVVPTKITETPAAAPVVFRLPDIPAIAPAPARRGRLQSNSPNSRYQRSNQAEASANACSSRDANGLLRCWFPKPAVAQPSRNLLKTPSTTYPNSKKAATNSTANYNGA